MINIPGCAPVGDNFTETVFAILLFLQGLGSASAFDELGRPAWLFATPCTRAARGRAIYEEGVFAQEYGDPECLVEIGCWGPVVNCNIVQRGAINHMGGCMKAGGICIGCTMPGFPDKFTPFYKTPPGAIVSTVCREGVGAVVRRLRRLSNREGNREHRWDALNDVPSGWAHVQATSTVMDRTIQFFYERVAAHGIAKTRPAARREVDRFWGVDRPGSRRGLPRRFGDARAHKGRES